MRQWSSSFQIYLLKNVRCPRLTNMLSICPPHKSKVWQRGGALVEISERASQVWLSGWQCVVYNCARQRAARCHYYCYRRSCGERPEQTGLLADLLQPDFSLSLAGHPTGIHSRMLHSSVLRGAFKKKNGKSWFFGPPGGPPPPLPGSWSTLKWKKISMFILHFRLFWAF